MAEHATQAIIGHGMSLQRGGLLETDPFVEMHEAFNFDAPADEADEHETSHYRSPGGRKEFIGGMIDSGEGTFTFNWRPDLYAEQASLRGDAASRVLRWWRAVLPGAMETITFRGFVKRMQPTISPNAAITMAVTIRVGAVNVT